MHPLQEKFQVTVPAPKKDDPKHNQWASFESSRQSQKDIGCGDPNWKERTAADVDGRHFNTMPPGMDISQQDSAEINNMPYSMAGETDVSKDTNPESFSKGYRRREMKGTDDQYTGEHVDHFYGIAYSDEGDEGFAERCNYLDRM